MKFWHVLLILVLVLITAGCQKKPTITTTIQVDVCKSATPGIERDKCYLELAEEELDVSYCEKIDVSLWRDNCIRTVALGKADATLCKIINDKNELIECLKGVAKSSRNPELCKGITDGTQRDTCYFAVALDLMDNETCEGIVSDSSRYRCLAIINKNATFCEKINVTKGRDWCFYKLLSCEEISSSNVLDQCYLALSVKEINATMCDGIVNSTLRDQCLTGVSRAEKIMEELQKELDENESVIIKPM